MCKFGLADGDARAVVNVGFRAFAQYRDRALSPSALCEVIDLVPRAMDCIPADLTSQRRVFFSRQYLHTTRLGHTHALEISEREFLIAARRRSYQKVDVVVSSDRHGASGALGGTEVRR